MTRIPYDPNLARSLERLGRRTLIDKSEDGSFASPRQAPFIPRMPPTESADPTAEGLAGEFVAEDPNVQAGTGAFIRDASGNLKQVGRDTALPVIEETFPTLDGKQETLRLLDSRGELSPEGLGKAFIEAQGIEGGMAAFENMVRIGGTDSQARTLDQAMRAFGALQRSNFAPGRRGDAAYLAAQEEIAGQVGSAAFMLAAQTPRLARDYARRQAALARDNDAAATAAAKAAQEAQKLVVKQLGEAISEQGQEDLYGRPVDAPDLQTDVMLRVREAQLFEEYGAAAIDPERREEARGILQELQMIRTIRNQKPTPRLAPEAAQSFAGPTGDAMVGVTDDDRLVWRMNDLELSAVPHNGVAVPVVRDETEEAALPDGTKFVRGGDMSKLITKQVPKSAEAIESERAEQETLRFKETQATAAVKEADTVRMNVLNALSSFEKEQAAYEAAQATAIPGDPSNKPKPEFTLKPDTELAVRQALAFDEAKPTDIDGGTLDSLPIDRVSIDKVDPDRVRSIMQSDDFIRARVASDLRRRNQTMRVVREMGMTPDEVIVDRVDRQSRMIGNRIRVDGESVDLPVYRTPAGPIPLIEGNYAGVGHVGTGVPFRLGNRTFANGIDENALKTAAKYGARSEFHALQHLAGYVTMPPSEGGLGLGGMDPNSRALVVDALWARVQRMMEAQGE